MGTMTSTLVLAYIGGSLITVLMYSASNYPLISLLNKEEIIYEHKNINCLDRKAILLSSSFFINPNI